MERCSLAVFFCYYLDRDCVTGSGDVRLDADDRISTWILRKLVRCRYRDVVGLESRTNLRSGRDQLNADNALDRAGGCKLARRSQLPLVMTMDDLYVSRTTILAFNAR